MSKEKMQQFLDEQLQARKEYKEQNPAPRPEVLLESSMARQLRIYQQSGAFVTRK